MCLQASWRKNKLPSIEDRDQTNRVTILANSNHSHNSMTLTFSLQRTMAMTRTHAKYRGQRPAGSKDKVETNGRTDTTDRITYPASAVDNYYPSLHNRRRDACCSEAVSS